MNNLYTQNPKPAPEKKGVGDYLIIAFVIIGLFTLIMQNAIQSFVPEWYTGPFKYILGLIWVISSLSYLLLPFAIKRNGAKVAGIILSVLLVLFMLIQNIRFLLG